MPSTPQLLPEARLLSDGILLRATANAASTGAVLVSVHLDHCQDTELVRRAADMGSLDTVMIDTSQYDGTEDLHPTQDLIRYCHDCHIATKAEPVGIQGNKDYSERDGFATYELSMVVKESIIPAQKPALLASSRGLFDALFSMSIHRVAGSLKRSLEI